MHDILVACVHLAEVSGKIIRGLQDSQKGKVKYLNKDTGAGPVTEADLKIQRTIEHNLKELFPGITVRGEEDPSMYMKYEPLILP